MFIKHVQEKIVKVITSQCKVSGAGKFINDV
jgi:hypothetical protein